MNPNQATVFLDRDGVINRRIIDGYVTRWTEFQLLDGVVSSLVKLHQNGFRLAVVTNQRGIHLGLMTLNDVNHIHRKLSEAVTKAGGSLNEFYVCPHGRSQGCSCRKPKSGLLDQAHNHRPVNWPQSFLVGDSETDITAGNRRGVTTIKIGKSKTSRADLIVADLVSATRYILGTLTKPGEKPYWSKA